MSIASDFQKVLAKKSLKAQDEILSELRYDYPAYRFGKHNRAVEEYLNRYMDELIQLAIKNHESLYRQIQHGTGQFGERFFNIVDNVPDPYEGLPSQLPPEMYDVTTGQKFKTTDWAGQPVDPKKRVRLMRDVVWTPFSAWFIKHLPEFRRLAKIEQVIDIYIEKGKEKQNMKLSEIKAMLAEIVNEETFQTKDMEGPYTVYVKTGRLAGQTVMASKNKANGVYYYLNPDTGHDEPIGSAANLDIAKPKVGEGVGPVYTKDIKADPKHIDDPDTGKPERWRIKFQSKSDLKKHGNTEKSPVSEVKRSDLKAVIKELIDEMWVGFEEDKQREFMDNEKESVKANEVTMPNSKPTPSDPRQLWEIVAGLEIGMSVSFYNPNNPNRNTTAPWIYIKKTYEGGEHGPEESYKISVEPRMSWKPTDMALTGIEDVVSDEGLTEDEVSVALEAVAKNVKLLSSYEISVEDRPPKKRKYQGDPDHDIGDYEKFGPDRKRPDSSYVQEGKNMDKKQLLKKLIRESVEEAQSEMHGFEEQQELLSMKRIQSYAHWGFKNASKHPNEMQSLFQKIVKEIDGLVKEHEHGHEVPIKTKEESVKTPLGVTQETISKTKNLLDQMISQRKKK